MAELKDAADQFAKDLRNQNIAGLMMVFTPEGMGKAMALQGQMAAQGQRAPATEHAIVENGAEGDDHLVDIVMKGPDGDAALFTKWRNVGGSWKVNDIGVKA
ncbi:MAG: hypothetical protein IT303_12960 [Dehalococcoidia bacterium]|nr:hypothetical protein [Dehalococcoidia bacterium]